MRLIGLTLLLALAGCSAPTAQPTATAQPAPGTLRPYIGGLTTVGVGVGAGR